MSKLTEVLAKAMVTARAEEWNDKQTLAEAEQAINAYIAEVIGEDEPVGPHFTNITGGLPTQPTESCNFLRAEQRKRAGL